MSASYYKKLKQYKHYKLRPIWKEFFSNNVLFLKKSNNVLDRSAAFSHSLNMQFTLSHQRTQKLNCRTDTPDIRVVLLFLNSHPHSPSQEAYENLFQGRVAASGE